MIRRSLHRTDLFLSVRWVSSDGSDWRRHFLKAPGNPGRRNLWRIPDRRRRDTHRGQKSIYLDAKSCQLSLSNEYLAIMRPSKIRRKPLYEIRLFNRKRQFFQNATCRVAFLVGISLAFCHASMSSNFSIFVISNPSILNLES